MEEPGQFDDTYLLSVMREVLVGLALGFTAYLFFTAVQVSGSFVDLQMGFGIANVVDPLTGAQSPIIGNFKFIVAILLFLAVNGHHYLLQGLMDSYRWVPLSNELFARIYRGDVSNFLLDSFIHMFYLAFQLAGPLIVSLFLADVALGILARTAPQFNIFVVGLPFKILLGFVVILVMIPGFLFLFQHLFQTMFAAMRQLMFILQSA
jgi:flagellar biosynthetic protein FliR